VKKIMKKRREYVSDVDGKGAPTANLLRKTLVTTLPCCAECTPGEWLTVPGA
jgi:hypothetical protein